jgi:gliding motility-associated-like protein
MAIAQNLVPNPDFETYNSCPFSFSSMPYSSSYNNFPTVASWTNPVRFTSPDYLHVCAPAASGLQLPKSSFGYQAPHSGNAYTGIIAWEGRMSGSTVVLDYREYIQNKLSQPMQAGKRYCVSFFVSPTVDATFLANYVSIDEIGASFSAVRPADSANFTLTLPYHVKNAAGNFLSDTAGWHKITGTYLASGGEEWLTIGCFNNSGSFPAYIPFSSAPPNPGLNHRAYLFIEDVQVREIVPGDSVVRVTDTTVCKPSSNNIVLAASVAGTSRQWNTGAVSASIVANDTGTYWCISAMECGIVTDTFHIRYQEPKKLDLGQDSVNCFGLPITLHATPGFNSYAWNTGAQADSLLATQSGVYVVTAQDVCGSQSDTVEVTIQPPTPAPLVRDTVICQFDHNPVLDVSGANLLWYTIHQGMGGVPNQPYIYANETGTEVLYVTQTIGKCESPKVPVHIKIRYRPDPDIGDYISICQNADTLIGRAYPDVFYSWSTGENVCCITPRHTGTYKLTITNDCGSASDTAFVDISSCDECLFIPNAFSPNSDGRNDIFGPVSICPVTGFRMQVFNRWGQALYTTTNIAKGWNGLHAPSGVYVFVVEYQSLNTGSRKFVKGNVTLVR